MSHWEPYVCDCDCHTYPDAVRHIIECCEGPCSVCGRNVTKIEAHMKHAHEEPTSEEQSQGAVNGSS
jgi:hypothetical protein